MKPKNYGFSTSIIPRHFRLCMAILCVTVVSLTAQSSCGGETDNVLLITLDGLRWQELFSGADHRLISNR